MSLIPAGLRSAATPLVPSDRPLIVSNRGIGGPDGFEAYGVGPYLAGFGLRDPGNAQALRPPDVKCTVA